MMSKLIIALVASLSVGLVAGVATTDVVCAADWSWASNSKSQSPCLVAAELVAAPTCFNSVDYKINKIAASGWYTNSPKPPPCMCSFAAYSLFSGCAACQGATWLTWASWTLNCTETFDDYQGNIPADTEIPGWANLDVQKQNNFDPAAAKSFAVAASSSSAAEASSSSLASVSSASVASVQATKSKTFGGSVTNSGSPTTPTSLASKGDSTPSAEATNASSKGPIIGGVIGGVAAILLIGSVAWWLRKKTLAEQAQSQGQYAAPHVAGANVSVHEPDSSMGHRPTMSLYESTGASSPPPQMSQYGDSTSATHGAFASPRLYNPNDASTWPASGNATSSGTGAYDPFQTPMHTPGMDSAYNGGAHYMQPSTSSGPISYGSQGGHAPASGYKGFPEV